MFVFIVATCAQCGAEIRREQDWKPAASGRAFCNRSCSVSYQNRVAPKRKRIVRRKRCEWCDEEFTINQRGLKGLSRRHCSRECAVESREIPLTWDGVSSTKGRLLDRSKGYFLVLAPEHPRANNKGFVYEHRLVAEEMLGRRLTSKEHVHHRNGKRWDNRPENLEVMSASDHAKLGGQRPEDLVI
ncbi:MAG: hypothetical protein JWM98_3309 [Thermoleophilia bacterium]|nr:hypothetical protein [Thermoleophilia bacterium]